MTFLNAVAMLWPATTYTTIARALLAIAFVSMFSLCSAQSVFSRADGGTKPKIKRENIPYFITIKDESHLNRRALVDDPGANLKKYPIFEYRANANRIVPIELNKTISEEIWDLPIRIVNDFQGRDSVTLRELAYDKLLVLDFWSTWCSPCLESMQKWKELQPKYASQVQVVGLMLDYDYRAELTSKKRGWKMPLLIGPEVYLLNVYFLSTPIVGPSAWIKDGKFIGATETRANKDEVVKQLLTGTATTIPKEFIWKMEEEKKEQF